MAVGSVKNATNQATTHNQKHIATDLFACLFVHVLDDPVLTDRIDHVLYESTHSVFHQSINQFELI